jgi:hypothetical protein
VGQRVGNLGEILGERVGEGVPIFGPDSDNFFVENDIKGYFLSLFSKKRSKIALTTNLGLFWAI